MLTVKTKKELIKAIEDGEKHIKIDSKPLYAACKLAETYDSTTAFKTLCNYKDNCCISFCRYNEYCSRRYRRSNNNNNFCVGSCYCYYWNPKG